MEASLVDDVEALLTYAAVTFFVMIFTAITIMAFFTGVRLIWKAIKFIRSL